MLGWDFIYSIIFNYPEQGSDLSTIRKKGYITFFTYLQYILPCKKIRKSYTTFINKYPIEKYMKTREELVEWCYRMEKTLRKNCCSFENRCKKIEKYRVSKCKNKSCRKNIFFKYIKND
jgi:hypothetical protein